MDLYRCLDIVFVLHRAFVLQTSNEIYILVDDRSDPYGQSPQGDEFRIFHRPLDQCNDQSVQFSVKEFSYDGLADAVLFSAFDRPWAAGTL